MKPGNINFLEPSGTLQACNGTALPYKVYTCRRFTFLVVLFDKFGLHGKNVLVTLSLHFITLNQVQNWWLKPLSTGSVAYLCDDDLTNKLMDVLFISWIYECMYVRERISHWMIVWTGVSTCWVGVWIDVCVSDYLHGLMLCWIIGWIIL